jgi:tol-pal system protein YbgF
MRTHLASFVLAIFAFVATGCAVNPSSPGGAGFESELARLRQDQRDLARQLERTQDNLLLMEARFQDQQKYLEQLRDAAGTGKVTEDGEMTASGENGDVLTSLAPGAGSPTDIYLKAFADYAAGRYPQSILGFESFLKTYPNSEYAGNAQFWLGECYYSLQRYPRAIEEFRKVVDLYPQGGKAPEALLKTAAAQLELRQMEQARETLQVLRRLYPDSDAAKKSRQGE